MAEKEDTISRKYPCHTEMRSAVVQEQGGAAQRVSVIGQCMADKRASGYTQDLLYFAEKIRLTKKPLLRRFPLESNQLYNIIGRISYTSNEDRIVNACLVSVCFFDVEGIKLPGPYYQGLKKSAAVGSFSYLPICNNEKAANLLTFKCPDKAKEVELGFRIWAAKQHVYISDVSVQINGVIASGGKTAVDAQPVMKDNGGGISSLRHEPKDVTGWWSNVSEGFRDRCGQIELKSYELSSEALQVRDLYFRRFGRNRINTNIHKFNWARADIFARSVHPAESLLDIGSGLGEFINMVACRMTHKHIVSVDVKNWWGWFDAFGRIKRVYRDIFMLGDELSSDVVTCFEVLEHLPPERLEEAIGILRSLARRKLYVSVPFMEKYPLSRGHHSVFDEELIMKYFPEAAFTVLRQLEKSRMPAWIFCEIDCAS
jgi:hypothetical protein